MPYDEPTPEERPALLELAQTINDAINQVHVIPSVSRRGGLDDPLVGALETVLERVTAMTNPALRSVTVFVETTVTRTAYFSVSELAQLTGESEQDIQTNIDQGTFGAWVAEYLADAPNLIAAMDASPDATARTSAPDVSAVLRLRPAPWPPASLDAGRSVHPGGLWE